MADQRIYHLTSRAEWEAALSKGEYRAESLATQGFIHASTLEQVLGTANRFYRGRDDLVLLCILPSALSAELRYEPGNVIGATETTTSLFPHIYGPLNLFAVVAVLDFPPGADGSFDALPAGMSPEPHPLPLLRGGGEGVPSGGEASSEVAAFDSAGVRTILIEATNYDGAPHWSHPARLLEAGPELFVTETSAGVEVQTEAGPWTSPFDTRGYYWPDRWYNVIRLHEPGFGLNGWYCNIATPAVLDGDRLRYVDLQLDVRVFLRDGALVWELWDEDEFASARERYGYDETLVGRCRAAVDEIVALVEARAFPFEV